MELKRLWAVITRRWWLVLLPAAVTMILALPSLRQAIAPSGGYSVTLRFTASQVPGSSANTFQDQSYIPWLASEYAVNNLATWMRTESFAREIASNLSEKGKPYDTDTIRGTIAASDSARSIMTLVLAWPNEDELKQIAQAAVEVLQNRSQAYFPQLGAQKTVVTPLDSIAVVPVAPALSARFTPLVRVLLGLAAGVALAFLAEYLDPTLRTRGEVEALNLRVIGEIPPYKE